MAAQFLQGVPCRRGADRTLRRAARARRVLRPRAAGGFGDRRRLRAAGATRWPAALGSLRHAALHLDLALQVAGLTQEDRDTAARWIALAAAPDIDALEQRTAQLPAVKDLHDAEARLSWVDPVAGAP